MMPSATLGLLVYPKDFDACLQPCSFLSVSIVCSLRETIARKKRKRKMKRTSNVLASRNRKKNSYTLLNTDLWRLYLTIGIVWHLSVSTSKLIEQSVKKRYSSVFIKSFPCLILKSCLHLFFFLFCLYEQGHIQDMRYVYLCLKCIHTTVNENDEEKFSSK